MLTDGRTDDGQKVITIAHPEISSGELKNKQQSKFQHNSILYIYFNPLWAYTKFKDWLSIGAEKSLELKKNIGEKEKCTNKENDKQEDEDADSLLHNQVILNVCQR